MCSSVNNKTDVRVYSFIYIKKTVFKIKKSSYYLVLLILFLFSIMFGKKNVQYFWTLLGNPKTDVDKGRRSSGDSTSPTYLYSLPKKYLCLGLCLFLMHAFHAEAKSMCITIKCSGIIWKQVMLRFECLVCPTSSPNCPAKVTSQLSFTQCREESIMYQ